MCLGSIVRYCYVVFMVLAQVQLLSYIVFCFGYVKDALENILW